MKELKAALINKKNLSNVHSKKCNYYFIMPYSEMYLNMCNMSEWSDKTMSFTGGTAWLLTAKDIKEKHNKLNKTSNEYSFAVIKDSEKEYSEMYNYIKEKVHSLLDFTELEENLENCEVVDLFDDTEYPNHCLTKVIRLYEDN